MTEEKDMSSHKDNLPELPKLPIEKISTGKWNVRTLDKEKGIEELAKSILKYGLLQPVVVIKDDGNYEIIIGQRRLLAFRELKKKGHSQFSKIPVILLEKKPTEEKLKILSLSENIHRVELNRADIVDVISFLYKKYNKSAKKVAGILGKSIPYVYDHLKIQDAPEEVKDMLSKKELTKEDVKRVMEIAGDKKEKMITLAKEMKKLTPFERKRLAEVGKIKSKAEVKELVSEAKKPHIEEKVIVPLTPSLIKALDTAVKEIGLTREEITKKALKEWLGDKGFFKE